MNFILSLIVVCAWCKKVIGGDGTGQTSHGICRDCEKKM